MNEYDSARVYHMLAPRGFAITTDINLADVIFLNTCSVRDKAEQKVYSFLGRLRRMKSRNPHLKILVGGCVAQQLGEKLLERFHHLDLVLGTRSLSQLPQLLEHVQNTNARLAYLHDEPMVNAWLAAPPRQSTAPVAAPVTIMQGCDNFCTYCIVPYVRGRERSRPSDEIIDEIRWLMAGGTREITLLGQNVNSYGKGLRETTSFADLLRRLQEETAVARLRFTTSHPKDLTNDLTECFKTVPALCKHLHLPVQAGSDRVLSRMNRRYSAADYLERIDRVRQVCPEIGLSSDVMVGFPGENEEDFHATLRLLERVQFDTLFSFRYSDRPHAKSTQFGDKVAEEVKARRLVELQALQASISMKKNHDEVGRIREILVEGPSKSGSGQLTGRTQQNRIVNFEGPSDLLGTIVPVKIVAAFSHSLKGKAFP